MFFRPRYRSSLPPARGKRILSLWLWLRAITRLKPLGSKSSPLNPCGQFMVASIKGIMPRGWLSMCGHSGEINVVMNCLVRQYHIHRVRITAHACNVEAGQIASLINCMYICALRQKYFYPERAKLLLDEKRQQAVPRAGAFDELFELAMGFLSSPSKIWALGKLEYQKLVLRLTFADRLAWCPESGFQTSKTTMSFRMLEATAGGQNMMAEGVSSR